MFCSVNHRLLLKFPFGGDNEENKIIHGKLDFSAIPCSESLRDLLKHMLDCSQETRYSADDVINHQWMQREYEETVIDYDHYPLGDSDLEMDLSSTSEIVVEWNDG